jgi:hypothetical protein
MSDVRVRIGFVPSYLFRCSPWCQSMIHGDQTMALLEACKFLDIKPVVAEGAFR